MADDASDESERNPTTPKSTLSPAQEAALEMLLSGARISDVAKAIGVARPTVSGWANGRDPVFYAVYRARRDEIAAATRTKLEDLSVRALEVVEGLLKATNWRARFAASKLILDHIHAAPAPSPAQGRGLLPSMAELVESGRMKKDDADQWIAAGPRQREIMRLLLENLIASTKRIDALGVDPQRLREAAARSRGEVERSDLEN